MGFFDILKQLLYKKFLTKIHRLTFKKCDNGNREKNMYLKEKKTISEKNTD
jgi:hypothetical protein